MSQAVRTVLWMMLYKKLPFELIITAPGSPKENGTRHPSYLEKYPNGTIPGLEDPETDQEWFHWDIFPNKKDGEYHFLLESLVQ